MAERVRPTVYLETSVVSYAAGRPVRDRLVALRQEITREWVARCMPHFDCRVSQAVIDEAALGDATAAAERLRLIADVPLLAVTGDAGWLSARLLAEGALPSHARYDALHIAIAAAHGIDYLLTWNCKHIANAWFSRGIEQACRDAGFEPPVICTPEELQRAI